MRLIIGVGLLLLFLWLYQAQTLRSGLQRDSCVAVSVSEAAASLLLSPLSLYCWLTSTLLRLVLSFPSLLLTSVHHSLLLLLAWPWSLLSICVSLALTCLRVALYLLHLAVALAVVAVLTVTRHQDGEKACQREKDATNQDRTQAFQPQG